MPDLKEVVERPEGYTLRDISRWTLCTSGDWSDKADDLLYGSILLHSSILEPDLELNRLPLAAVWAFS